jgi:glycosyltransferase involved in cell wall biosynthesis
MGKMLLYGFHLFLLGILFYALEFVYRILSLFGISSSIVIDLLPNFGTVFFLLGAFFSLLNFGIARMLRPISRRKVLFDPIDTPKIAVGMTAYNDELSIGNAVKDFKAQENIAKVVVVDNNSTDRTKEEAIKAGAIVLNESTQGYGACCIRALKEAYKNGNLIALVEGDGTFSGTDLQKFVAYIENADMVVGTRTTRELASPDSQMNWFMQYGNLVMAKLIQLRFWETRLTDVGCTFRLIRKEALSKIIDQLTVKGNHFSPHMILVALKNDLKVLEIPITFKRRVGKSKGVGGNVWKGFKTGLRMWWMILAS